MRESEWRHRVLGIVERGATKEVADHVAKVMDEPCEWQEDEDGAWDTGCGETWQFDDGGPIENRIRYCHRCGAPVRVLAFREED